MPDQRQRRLGRRRLPLLLPQARAGAAHRHQDLGRPDRPVRQPSAGRRRQPVHAHLPLPRHRGALGDRERRRAARHRGRRPARRDRQGPRPQPRACRRLPSAGARQAPAGEGHGATDPGRARLKRLGNRRVVQAIVTLGRAQREPGRVHGASLLRRRSPASRSRERLDSKRRRGSRGRARSRFRLARAGQWPGGSRRASRERWATAGRRGTTRPW